MEGWRLAIGIGTLHFCHWRHINRLGREENTQLSNHPDRLALVVALYHPHYPALAAFRTGGKHTAGAVPLFYQLYPQNGSKTGIDEGR